MVSYIYPLFILALITKPIWSQNRVVGGQGGRIQDFPFMINIKVVGEGEPYACSGSILTEKWAVTAAHCFKHIGSGYTLDGFTVTSGDFYIYEEYVSRTRKLHTISQYVMHEKYHDSGEFGNDIAVFEVNEPYVFGSNVAPIKLPTSAEEVNVPVARAAGYGCARYYWEPNGFLQYTWLKKVSDEECAERNPEIEEKGSVLCYVASNSNPGTPGNLCFGDSGGPLFNDDKTLMGVFSTFTPRDIYSPSTYANAFFYRDWIIENTDL